MSKLEQELNNLEKYGEVSDISAIISALRKALEQRDLSIYNLQAYLGTNIQKEISNKFDAEILKILEGE